MTIATMSSVQRLLGLEPNAREVQMYGVMTPTEIKRKTTRLEIPNINMIDSEGEEDD